MDRELVSVRKSSFKCNILHLQNYPVVLFENNLKKVGVGLCIVVNKNKIAGHPRKRDTTLLINKICI